MGKYSSIDGCIESFYQSKTIIVSGKVYDIKEYKNKICLTDDSISFADVVNRYKEYSSILDWF